MPPWVSVAVHDADERVVDHVARRRSPRSAGPSRPASHGAYASVAFAPIADDRRRWSLLRRQRVGEPAGSVVDPVVVRHRHHVDAGDPQGLERRRPVPGSCTTSGTGLPPSVIAVSRFTTATSAAESSGAIGREHPRRVGVELRAQPTLEVHVAAEDERDGLPAAPPGPGGRGRRRRDSVVPADARDRAEPGMPDESVDDSDRVSIAIASAPTTTASPMSMVTTTRRTGDQRTR